MKILMVGVCDKPESTNTFMVKALRSLGHEVIAYNYRAILANSGGDPVRSAVEIMNHTFMHYVTYSDAELVIFCKTDTISSLTLNYTSQLKKTFYWFMDPLGTAKNMNAHLLAKEAHYVSATASEVVEFFEYTGSKNVVRIPEGVDTKMYSPLPDEDKKYSIVFIGSRTMKREKHIIELNIAGFDVQVFGNGWPDSIQAKPPVYNEDLVKVINQSKVVLNFVHGDSYSDRVTLTLAAGGFLVSEHADDISIEYTPGKHLVLWKDMNQLFEHLDFYLTDKTSRDKIAKQGSLKAREFTWEFVCERILGAAKK